MLLSRQFYFNGSFQGTYSPSRLFCWYSDFFGARFRQYVVIVEGSKGYWGDHLRKMVTHTPLSSMLPHSIVWGRVDTCVCMAKALCCSPETIATLSVGYIPIENKKFFKKNNRKMVTVFRFQKRKLICFFFVPMCVGIVWFFFTSHVSVTKLSSLAR